MLPFKQGWREVEGDKKNLLKVSLGCSPLGGIFRYYVCVVDIQTKSRLIKVQQWGGKKSSIASYFYGEIFYLINFIQSESRKQLLLLEKMVRSTN